MRPTSAHPKGRVKGGNTTDEDYQTSQLFSGSEAYDTDKQIIHQGIDEVSDDLEEMQQNDDMLDKFDKMFYSESQDEHKDDSPIKSENSKI